MWALVVTGLVVLMLIALPVAARMRRQRLGDVR
jgi:hypothetical protein